jgi:hypothetical protein
MSYTDLLFLLLARQHLHIAHKHKRETHPKIAQRVHMDPPRCADRGKTVRDSSKEPSPITQKGRRDVRNDRHPRPGGLHPGPRAHSNQSSMSVMPCCHQLTDDARTDPRFRTSPLAASAEERPKLSLRAVTTRQQELNGALVLAEGAPSLMQRPSRLPAPPHIGASLRENLDQTPL